MTLIDRTLTKGQKAIQKALNSSEKGLNNLLNKATLQKPKKRRKGVKK